MNLHPAQIAGPKRTRIPGVVTGREKYTFLYFVMGGIGLTAAIFYASMAHLAPVQTVLLLIGLPLVACAFVFSFVEVRKAAPPDTSAEPGPDLTQYAERPVDLKPPTGEPYPHHEYFTESQGFDQSQLTARIPDETPFLEAFFERRRARKEEARKAARL